MLFPRGSHTMEKLLFSSARHSHAALKYAIPTLKNEPKAAGASGYSAGRVFQTAFLMKGSLTVEAALVLPICLGILFALAGLIQAVTVTEQINHQLCMTARKAAAYSVSEDGISQAEVMQCFYSGLAEGTFRADRVIGGAAGILVTVSQNAENGIFCLKASYMIKLPGVFGVLKRIPVSDRVYGRAWTGIPLTDGNAGAGSAGEGKTVYVAENGVVYHTDSSCTYLDLSIHAVSVDSLEYKRNLSGSRYVPCSKCAGGAHGIVYITNQGDAWHSDPHCSGLKRTISLENEEDAHEHGLRPCPRCGGGE